MERLKAHAPLLVAVTVLVVSQAICTWFVVEAIDSAGNYVASYLGMVIRDNFR